jgi:hypothetical protein
LDVSPSRDAVDAARRGPGKALDPAIGARMSSSFGHDFSRVRVHTDSNAAAAAAAVNALAFTVGPDVVFAAQHFAPATTAGLRLLAHELAHTVQQQADPRSGVVQRQQAAPKHPVPGLGSALTQRIEQLIAAKQMQEAVDVVTWYAGEGLGKAYRVDTSLLLDDRMTFDSSVTSADAVTSMPAWDYLANKAEPAKVRIGPSAFSSAPYLYSVIVHEYQHVLWQQSLSHQKESHLLHGQGFETPDEVEASAWELLNATETGLVNLPNDVAHVWKTLNGMFWKLDAQSQAQERPLALRAFQKAKDLTKTSKTPLVPFSPP